MHPHMNVNRSHHLTVQNQWNNCVVAHTLRDTIPTIISTNHLQLPFEQNRLEATNQMTEAMRPSTTNISACTINCFQCSKLCSVTSALVAKGSQGCWLFPGTLLHDHSKLSTKLSIYIIRTYIITLLSNKTIDSRECFGHKTFINRTLFLYTVLYHSKLCTKLSRRHMLEEEVCMLTCLRTLPPPFVHQETIGIVWASVKD